MTYEDWAARHAKIFNLNSETDSGLLTAWIGVFRTCGYSVEELFDATDSVAASIPIPETRMQNLAALHATIRAGRIKRPEFQGDYSVTKVCTFDLCGGTGFVTVPHPRSMNRGQWVYPWHTCAVLCKCDQGRWAGTRQSKKQNMTLEFYERGNPRWQEQMENRKRQKSEQRRVENMTRQSDPQSTRMQTFGKAFDAVIERLKSRNPY